MCELRRIVFITASHFPLMWTKFIWSSPFHTVYTRYTFTLPSLVHLGLPSGPFSSGSSTQTVYVSLRSPILATCLAHFIHLAFITWIVFGENYRSWSSSLCNFLQSPFTSSLLGQNIFLSNLFSTTLRLCSYHNMKDQVPHPHKTVSRMAVLCVIIRMVYSYIQGHRKRWTGFETAIT